MKAVQKFSDEYLKQCQSMSTDEIVKFLDDFRSLHGSNQTSQQNITIQKKKPQSKLISMKVPEDLLSVFRAKAKLTNTPYQTQIKQLMLDWVK